MRMSTASADAAGDTEKAIPPMPDVHEMDISPPAPQEDEIAAQMGTVADDIPAIAPPGEAPEVSKNIHPLEPTEPQNSVTSCPPTLSDRRFKRAFLLLPPALLYPSYLFTTILPPGMVTQRFHVLRAAKIAPPRRAIEEGLHAVQPLCCPQ